VQVHWWLALAIAIAVIAVVPFLTWRRRRSPPRWDGQALTLPLPKSPMLRVSFEEAFETHALASAISDFGRESVAVGLGIDAAHVGLQALSLVQRGGQLVMAVQFTEAGTGALKAGSAYIPLHGDSSVLPMLADKETGRFLEIAKCKSPNLLKLAEVSALIVSAAHVIAGMDVVKRLDKVDRKLDELLAGRVIDQRAKLKRIYLMAGELLAGVMTEGDRNQLRGYRSELLDLRLGWQGELARSLRQAPDPNKVSLINQLTKFGQGRREAKLKEALNENADRLRLYRTAFLMDLCLAQSTGTAHLFIRQTAAGELRSWSPIATDFRRLVEKITNPSVLTDVVPLRDAVTGFTSSLECLVHGRSISSGVKEVEP